MTSAVKASRLTGFPAELTSNEGEAMHRAREALFAVVGVEPLVSTSVQMDLSVFRRISQFVGGGAFIVGKKGAYAEARTSSDF